MVATSNQQVIEFQHALGTLLHEICHLRTTAQQLHDIERRIQTVEIRLRNLKSGIESTAHSEKANDREGNEGNENGSELGELLRDSGDGGGSYIEEKNGWDTHKEFRSMHRNRRAATNGYHREEHVERSDEDGSGTEVGSDVEYVKEEDDGESLHTDNSRTTESDLSAKGLTLADKKWLAKMKALS